MLRVKLFLFIFFYLAAAESKISILCTNSSGSNVKLDLQEALIFNTQTEKSKSRLLLEPTLCTSRLHSGSYTYYNKDCSPAEDKGQNK